MTRETEGRAIAPTLLFALAVTLIFAIVHGIEADRLRERLAAEREKNVQLEARLHACKLVACGNDDFFFCE